MTHVSRILVPAAVVALAFLGTPRRVWTHPGGTPRAVTNAAPYCAECHSSASAEQLRELPDSVQSMLLPEHHHYARISAGEGNYQKLAAADRDKLLEAVKAMDAHSSVSLATSATKVRPGGPLRVTVTTRGGAGPVVGVMLTDNDLRFQSSPVQAEGFLIEREPQVTGPDGKPQTKFLDARYAGLSKGINFVNILEVHSDPEANHYPECKVVYLLKAPARKGVYTISAAFLYGTEKASPVGRVEGPGGRVGPAGGPAAGSGRIQFAKPVHIKVS